MHCLWQIGSDALLGACKSDDTSSTRACANQGLSCPLALSPCIQLIFFVMPLPYPLNPSPPKHFHPLFCSRSLVHTHQDLVLCVLLRMCVCVCANAYVCACVWGGGVQDAFAKLHYARASNEQLRVALSAVLEKHIYRFTICAYMSQVHCVHGVFTD
jgi:hypothetical protein